MTSEEWTTTIRKACEDAGTYRPIFDHAIGQLADIMEIMDAAKRQYEQTGGNPVVSYTNKGGHKNYVKNPALAVIQDCNQQALAYWRDLGLTPSGFKKLDGQVVKIETDKLSELLKDLGA